MKPITRYSIKAGVHFHSASDPDFIQFKVFNRMKLTMFGTVTASVSDPDLPDPDAKKMTKMTTGIFLH